MIPGSNLLEDAFEAIDTITIQYLRFAGRSLNPVGQYVASFEPPLPVEASCQAVQRNTYVELGLDFQKQYVQIYASIGVTDLDRDVTGDRFILPDGRVYQCENQLDWFTFDGVVPPGWVGVLCVKVDTP